MSGIDKLLRIADVQRDSIEGFIRFTVYSRTIMKSRSDDSAYRMLASASYRQVVILWCHIFGDRKRKHTGEKPYLY